MSAHPFAAPEPWDLVADGYAETTHALLEPFSARALELVAPGPHARVLDVAAGPGTLSLPAARQCFDAFFGRNEPGAGAWTINGAAVDPARLRVPALVVSAGTDRIVPQESSSALAGAIPGAAALCVNAGHVGMVASRRAPSLLWEPLARWLAGA